VENCIFCEIARGKIPCNKVYEDELVMAFDDIHPMAPVHVIIVPKNHIATVMDMDLDHADVSRAFFRAIQAIAKQKNVDQTGFRTVINCNEEGGQVVFHLHLHLLGGKKLVDELG